MNMAKHKVTEKSLKNLTGAGRFANNKEVAKECQAKSVEARKANKERRENLASFAEYIQEIGSELVDYKGEQITKKETLMRVLFQLASKGNYKAIELLAKLLGEIDSNKNIMVNGNLGVQKIFITPEENAKLDAKIDELLNG